MESHTRLLWQESSDPQAGGHIKATAFITSSLSRRLATDRGAPTTSWEIGPGLSPSRNSYHFGTGQKGPDAALSVLLTNRKEKHHEKDQLSSDSHVLSCLMGNTQNKREPTRFAVLPFEDILGNGHTITLAFTQVMLSRLSREETLVARLAKPEKPVQGNRETAIGLKERKMLPCCLQGASSMLRPTRAVPGYRLQPRP